MATRTPDDDALMRAMSTGRVLADSKHGPSVAITAPRGCRWAGSQLGYRGRVARAGSATPGKPSIEEAYRTHWVSPRLSEAKHQRLVETASRAPELVVIN